MFKNNPLDTLVFDDNKILFKQLHALRSFEAMQYLNIKISYTEVEKFYDEIEILYQNKITSSEKLRIIFQTVPTISYNCEIQKIDKINSPLKLNTVELEKSPPPESVFKWQQRDYWSNLIKQKKPEADDILVVSPNYDLIEASRFNVFCYDEVKDLAYTPLLDSGCVNGVFRRYALNEKSIVLPDKGVKKLIERPVKLDELSYYDLYVANSVRGVLKAILI